MTVPTNKQAMSKIASTTRTQFGIFTSAMLTGLRHAEMCFHWLADFKAYQEQMDRISSPNGSYRYSPIHCAYLGPSATHFTLATPQNWPRDRKSAQSCWCLHWLRSLRADILKYLWQSVVKPAKLLKSAIKKRDPKQHLSRHISRLKVA